MGYLLKQFNRMNLSILLFIIACANYLGFQLYGGEEQYFAFAKQYLNPAWIPGSFSLTHPAGGNLFFELIAGFALQYLTFEQLAFFGRLVNFLLLSFPLSRIFKHFKFSNIEAVFLFQLFFLPHQSIFAGEWVFQNFEVKTLAYIFVFYAIYYLLIGRIQLCALFSAIATLFHFLVGGWFFVFTLIYFFIQKETFKKIGTSLLIYGVIVMPFCIYLAKLFLFNNPAVIEGVNTNWIYCYQRLPFHLGIFKSWDYFRGTHLDGVLISLVFFLLCLFYFRRFKHQHIRTLNLLNIIIFSEQFLFILIAIFDRNGTLLKTYPFRTSALSSLLMLIQLFLIIKIYACKRITAYIVHLPSLMRRFTIHKKRLVYANAMNTLFLGLFIVFFSIECAETREGKNTDVLAVTVQMNQLMDYIHENTAKDAKFLFTIWDQPLSFHRKAEREPFVTWKFTPTLSQAIYEQYDRQLWKNRVTKNISFLDPLIEKYKVDYLISRRDLNDPLLRLVKTFGDLHLYSVSQKIPLETE